MNTIQIILIILILSVSSGLIYSLFVLKLWPWDLSDISLTWIKGEKTTKPKQYTGVIPDKSCKISGDLMDYNNSEVSKTNVPCDQCINYISKTSKGCYSMQYDGDSSCSIYGDLTLCPTKVTTYANYKKL